MGPYAEPFPPSASAFQKYHAFNRGQYHAWYETYLKMLKEKVPGIDLQLIPVASVLSKLLTETALRDIKAGDLYSDNAPHGKPTIYLLAALITYSKVYGAMVPEGYDIPASVHPLVKQNYGQIADMICAETGCK